MVNMLVAAGANVNAIDGEGSTPLHMMVSNDSLCDEDIAANTIIDILLAGGARVDATDAVGHTPLHLAALHGKWLAVERLIVAGGDVELLDPRGGGLLHYVACSPRTFPASFLGMYGIVTLDINAQDHMGLAPLHWAAGGSHNRANLKMMFEAGADINARDHRGRTPLHHAARLGTPRITKHLISAGADANALDGRGDTPLMLAARTGSYESVIRLLKAGASALEAAIEFGEPLAIQRRGYRYSNIFSRLLSMVRFLTKDPNPPSRAHHQLQTTLLANLHDVYKNYPLRALQKWSFRRDRILEELQHRYPQLPVYDMQVRILGQGGFGDCYLGMFFGRSVVSKQLRFHYEPERYMKHLLHEATIWKKLNHPNIVPLLGSPSIDGLPHLMSPLMENGAADDFVKKNPNVNRVRLLEEIAQGLEYMHTLDPPIIHGDLKANNILVSADGSACLSDFGLSRTHMETSSDATLATTDGPSDTPITMAYHANFRWGAPEVLLNEGSHRTPASDIFSLGRLKVELLTGDVPFPGLTDYDIIQCLGTGHYDRPTDSDAIACGLDDEMWALILECWDLDPLERPSASQVVDRLRRMPEPASVNPSWKPCARAVTATNGDSDSGESLTSEPTD
ncbi:hypothetical protein BOTBODRAFT_521874 [Botryobasidium botryosum FD-172 SS1]|uniref:Protein kinase domain-containing protein n=1 Tax=Botryobasidium botryosum (strain FD-172 SS1) TaxID=930990 RepID=A0A067MCI4_BOTB1|nr:hypothetical protein BOTBODRAFT_521874 [Botryobasidium botryosum FD-172 SS1]